MPADLLEYRRGRERWSAHRPLTHSLDSTKEGLEVNSTQLSKSCSVEGCADGGRMTRGYCKRHYARVLRTGNPGGAEKMHAVSYAGQSCGVSDCENSPKAHGYCTAHYKRFRRYGDPLMRRAPRPYSESFEMYARRGPDCWEWTGTVGNHSYGIITSGRQSKLAHRWSYEHHIGPIPQGLVIDHLCRNRTCVNPDHMEAVTNEENLRRGEGYGIQNGMRSTCTNGHEYTPENSYYDPKGGLRCRQCARDRNAKRDTNAARKRRAAQRKATA